MTRDKITEAIIRAALASLEKRITEPPSPSETIYSRREAFLKLRVKAKEALAAGHSLQTILDDLKGVGLGMTLSTARQYLKPGKRVRKSKLTTARQSSVSQPAIANNTTQQKGRFSVSDDDTDI
jgi:hypothetical protein